MRIEPEGKRQRLEFLFPSGFPIIVSLRAFLYCFFASCGFYFMHFQPMPALVFSAVLYSMYIPALSACHLKYHGKMLPPPQGRGEDPVKLISALSGLPSETDTAEICRYRSGAKFAFKVSCPSRGMKICSPPTICLANSAHDLVLKTFSEMDFWIAGNPNKVPSKVKIAIKASTFLTFWSILMFLL